MWNSKNVKILRIKIEKLHKVLGIIKKIFFPKS